jgi:hypothetical protein
MKKLTLLLLKYIATLIVFIFISIITSAFIMTIIQSNLYGWIKILSILFTLIIYIILFIFLIQIK